MTHIVPFEKQKQELDYLRTLTAIASKSGQYRDLNPETMLNIMLTAKDLGISPMKALNGGFYIVNGKISMSTAMMADRIRRDGHSIKITEWTKEKCIIIGKRKDNEDSVKVEFTMEDAQLAGLTNSPTWKKFPKAMLYNRAMSMLARVLFPDVVGNCYSEDERYDIMNIPPEKRPIEDPDAALTLEVSEATFMQDKKEEPMMLLDSPYETLKELMTIEDSALDLTKLDEFLQERSQKSKKSIDRIIEAALLDKDMTKKFVNAYASWFKESELEATA